MVNRRRLIAVCGESNPQTTLREVAYAVGLGIATRGAALVCGGSTGVMEHAARGARAAGGLTIGILPGDEASAANDAIEVAIPTGLGQARNGVIVLSADGVIAIGGGLGTLSEIALALRAGRPAIGIQTWRFERDAQLEASLPAADSPESALEWLFTHLR